MNGRSILVLVGVLSFAASTLADVVGVYQGTLENPKQGISVAVNGPLALHGSEASGSLTLDPALGAPFADTFDVAGRVHGLHMVIKGTAPSGAFLIWRAKQLGATQGLYGGKMKVKFGKDKVKGTLTMQLLSAGGSTTTTTLQPPSGQLFTQNCQVCHGASAQGGIGPNIRCNTNIAPTVKSGKGAMPPFPQLTDVDIAGIQAYLVYLCAH